MLSTCSSNSSSSSSNSWIDSRIIQQLKRLLEKQNSIQKNSLLYRQKLTLLVEKQLPVKEQSKHSQLYGSEASKEGAPCERGELEFTVLVQTRGSQQLTSQRGNSSFVQDFQSYQNCSCNIVIVAARILLHNYIIVNPSSQQCVILFSFCNHDQSTSYNQIGEDAAVGTVFAYNVFSHFYNCQFTTCIRYVILMIHQLLLRAASCELRAAKCVVSSDFRTTYMYLTL